MARIFGLVCMFAVAVCITGCSEGGGTAVDNSTQDDIAAYEEMIAAEEAEMDATYTEDE